MGEAAPTAPPLRRVLPLWGLLSFGIAFVGLQAPFTMYGIGTARANGHLALTYALSTVAMMFTAVSFGRMASAHPLAGSSYAYATRELHPIAGFFTGWVMILDYVFIPIIVFIIIGVQMATLVPSVPYVAWVVGGAAIVTLVNLRGVEVAARFTLVFNVVCVAIIAWFVVLAVRALGEGVGAGTLWSVQPFYDPRTFGVHAVMSASAVTVLSFLGFDGVATLAEEAHAPERDIRLATVLTCLVCGIDFVVLSYLGQLLWPDWRRFDVLDAAFREIGGLVGGRPLFLGIAGIVVFQAFTAAITSQASASRLLLGMGREGRVPPRLFCRLHPKYGTPVFGTAAIGAAAATVPLVMTLDQASHFVTFGAVLGFIGVNLSALARAHREWRSTGHGAVRLAAPLAGVLTCAAIWTTLSPWAMAFGTVWLGAGALWLWWASRRGFRGRLDSEVNR